MWHLGTWFSGGLGSVRFMVGPDDLKGLFQPKYFCDSMILRENIQQQMNQALDEAVNLGFPKIEEKLLKKAERLFPSCTRTHCLVTGKVEATRAITPVA